MSDSLWPHGLQCARFPCISLFPGVCSNLCPVSKWRYLTISSSAALFFSLQSLPASGSFLMSWLFASGGPNIKLSQAFHRSGHREKISIYKLGSRPGLSDLESSGTLILEILIDRTNRNKCLLLKSSSLRSFCVAAWTDWDNTPENGTKDLQITYLINLVSLLYEEFF